MNENELQQATDGTSAITLETDLALWQHHKWTNVEQKDVLFSAQLLLVSFLQRRFLLLKLSQD